LGYFLDACCVGGFGNRAVWPVFLEGKFVVISYTRAQGAVAGRDTQKRPAM
jgi:hypothetical protein